MNRLPVALQPYSVRDAAENDFFGTLGRVKEIGYDYVEIIDNLYGFAVSEVRAEMDKLGLKAILAHVSIDLLMKDTERTIQEFASLDCRYISIP